MNIFMYKIQLNKKRFTIYTNAVPECKIFGVLLLGRPAHRVHVVDVEGVGVNCPLRSLLA